MSEEERRKRRNARRWCRRKHSLVDAICVQCCYVSATERHHVNGDVTDNSTANVWLVCERCHDSLHEGERWHADRDPSRWVSNGGTGAVAFGYVAH